jgi:hypothetical protein
MPQKTLEWLFANHSVALLTIFLYVAIKLLSCLIMRTCLGAARSSMAEYSSRVWDPVCLTHNLVSVVAGLYSLAKWESSDAASTCTSLSDVSALVILLQAAHCISDFLVFLPQMIGDAVFIAHHAVLLIVSLVLPHCPGCYYVVVAFAIAELGSASIAVDAEWRKAGGASRGLKRVVIFGASRLVNLVLLYMIWQVTPSHSPSHLTFTPCHSHLVLLDWQVTPSVHEFTVHDSTDGSLLFKVPAIDRKCTTPGPTSPLNSPGPILSRRPTCRSASSRLLPRLTQATRSPLHSCPLFSPWGVCPVCAAA